jgi:hypothetical protein
MRRAQRRAAQPSVSPTSHGSASMNLAARRVRARHRSGLRGVNERRVPAKARATSCREQIRGAGTRTSVVAPPYPLPMAIAIADRTRIVRIHRTRIVRIHRTRIVRIHRTRTVRIRRPLAGPAAGLRRTPLAEAEAATGAAVRPTNGGVARYSRAGGAKAPPFHLQKAAYSAFLGIFFLIGAKYR